MVVEKWEVKRVDRVSECRRTFALVVTYCSNPVLLFLSPYITYIYTCTLVTCEIFTRAIKNNEITTE